MALKVKDRRYLARLVSSESERAPCAFCLRKVDDEITFGKLYSIGDIQCHYFCCLLSCCLIQKGQDEEGLFGFMYNDIKAEIERCKNHKCSYCGLIGANLGCSVGSCRYQFHLPCGREKNAVSLYYGTYKSFCQRHAPKQKIPDHIMAKAKLRMRGRDRNAKTSKTCATKDAANDEEEMVCVICYEAVDGYPTHNTFWPPCCAKDAWFHRTCLQRMALSAGMHYLKCPLCNDKEQFYDAVVSQGFYVPDRDAAWELEQNAFAEIYERVESCGANICVCPMGREHDSENGEWDIKLCLLCGSAGAHAKCIYEETKHTNTVSITNNTLSITNNTHSPTTNTNSTTKNTHSTTNNTNTTINNAHLTTNNPLSNSNPSNDQSPSAPDVQQWDNSTRYVCKCCLPAAPEDLGSLAKNIEAIIRREQAANASNVRRPLMPSRMSLRRTKGRSHIAVPSSSNNASIKTEMGTTEQTNIQMSRQELNLKSPRKLSYEETTVVRQNDKLLSPFKLLEQSFKEKVVCTGVRDAVLDDAVIEQLRRRFRKPRPLSEKKKIVNDILDGLFDDIMRNPKEAQIREWCTPKKSSDIKNEIKAEAIEISSTLEKDDEIVNIDITPTKKIPTDRVNICEMPLIALDSKFENNKEIETNETVNEDLKLKLIQEELEIKDVKSECETKEDIKDEIKTKDVEAEIKVEHVEAEIETKEDSKEEVTTNGIKEGLKTREESPNKASVGRNAGKKKIIKKELNSKNKKNRKQSKAKDKTKKESKLKRDTIVENIDSELFSGDMLKNLLMSELSPRSNPTRTHDPLLETIDNEKHRKTIDTLQDSSVEISENDQTINIDVIKLDENSQKDAYKKLMVTLPDQASSKLNQSRIEKLENTPFDMDLEKFKTEYLNEVDKKFKCSYNHKHVEKPAENVKIRTAIDFAMDAIVKKECAAKIELVQKEQKDIGVAKKKKTEERVKIKEDCAKTKEGIKERAKESVTNRKRKLSSSLHCNDNIKKRKTNNDSKMSLDSKRESRAEKEDELISRRQSKKRSERERMRNRKEKSVKKKTSRKNIEVTIDSSEKRSKDRTIKKKIKTKFAIRDSNIKVKILWKKKQLSLNIESKKQKIKEQKKKDNSKFKQYVLQFPEGSSKEVLVKPEKDVKLKRKYVKQDKSPDKFKQMSIQSFFKQKFPSECDKD